MDLSIASATATSYGMSAQGRTGAQADSAKTTPQSDTVTPDGSPTSKSESVSERPTRETQQTSRLPPEEQQQLHELQQRDRQVKAHELAHKSVGGRYVTGGSFTYQTGPDGRRYAIGGEVTIDSSSGSTPQETLRKAEMIRAAALAPSDPSSQDYRVASQANLQAAQARSEIAAEQRAEQLQRREAMREQSGEEAATENNVPLRNRRAISSFEAVGGSSLHSDPDPIDELI